MVLRRNKLSKPHFNLRDKRHPKELTPIMLFYNYSSDHLRLQYSVGEVVYPKHWDQNTCRAKLNVNNPDYVRINQKLDLIVGKAREIAQNRPFINPTEFKEELDYFLGVKHKSSMKLYPTLFEFIENFIQSERSKVNSKTTWKKYHTLFNHLKAFALDNGRKELNYEDIDRHFRQGFVNWCYSPPRNHSQNNLEKNLQTISLIMRKAINSEYKDSDGTVHKFHQNEFPLSKEFQINRVKTSRHPLNLEELKTLDNFNDLPEHLMIVKDYFLMSAFGGGFRYSDYSSISKANIFEERGVKLLRLYTKKGDTLKTSNEVTIPVLPIFQAILDKYDTLPPPKSSQKSNEQIKEICKRAGLIRLVLDQKSIGGKLVSTRVPIWQLVSNHTARFTFITIALTDYDLSPLTVSKITGQSIPVLLGYEKADSTQSAIKAHGQIIKAINQN